MMVDPETRLDTTVCSGKQLYYKYTMVNYSGNDADNRTFKNEMTATITNGQCKDQTLVNVLKMGVVYYFIYLDRNGNHIATINVSKESCGLK